MGSKEPYFRRNITIPYSLYQRMEEYSKRSNLSHQTIIVSALAQYLDQNAPPPHELTPKKKK